MSVRLDPSRTARPARRLFAVRLALFALLAVPLASAQTPISGPLSDGAGGPLGPGVYHVTGWISVPAGTTLTLQAGAILKFNGNGLSVDGTLLAQGASGNPVIFTCLQDDSAGGDSNGNGPSSGAPDCWAGLGFGPASDASVLEHVEVRYTGTGFAYAISLSSADITLSDGVVRDGQWGGVGFGGNSLPTITGTTFSANGNRPALDAVPFAALPLLTGNSHSGSGRGYVNVAPASHVSNVVFGPANSPTGVFGFDSSPTVAAGATLTMQAGTILKIAASHGWTVHGTLLTQGSPASPVVFTTLPDDAWGGDSDANGPTTGNPDSWNGLHFSDTSDASVLERTIVRYTGTSFTPAVRLVDSDATLRDCQFLDVMHGGLDLAGSSARPTVERCTILSVGVSMPAIRNVLLAAVPGFRDNVATGSARPYMDVTVGSPDTLTKVEKRNTLNGVLVINAGVSVPVGRTLRFEPGVVIKMGYGAGFVVSGTFDVNGSATQPVVITSIVDDSFGGDSIGDGPTSGAPDAWTGMNFVAGSSGVVKHMLVRYSGWGFTPNLRCSSSGVTLRSVRAEHGAHGGIVLEAAASPAQSLVAFGNNSFGINLVGGAFDLRNATAAQNNGFGMTTNGAWTGTASSCVSWGNASGANQVSGFLAGQLRYSDAPPFSGTDGNVSVDPQFLNQAGGDLRLASTSPLIDAGDPGFVLSGADPAGNPRLLDGDLDTVRVVDMGAFEFDHVTLGVSGTFASGQTITIASTGTAGMASFLFVGFAESEVGFKYYGPLFVDVAGPWFLYGWFPLPSSIPVTLPPGLPSGATVYIQQLALAGGPGSAGNLSNLVRLSVP